MKHIVLVGFMGAGKSTVGLQLSKHFKCPFYDLDNEIEKGEGLGISNLIKNSEDYFRKLETAYLKQILTKESGVIATGGGTFCQPKNQELLENETFQTFYLEMSEAFCLKQLESIQSSRPLLSKMKGENWKEEAMALYYQRQSQYEKADHQFLIDGWKTQKLISKIENIYGKVL